MRPFSARTQDLSQTVCSSLLRPQVPAASPTTTIPVPFPFTKPLENPFQNADPIGSGFPLFPQSRVGSRSPTTKTPPAPLPPPGPVSSLPLCGSRPSTPSPSPAAAAQPHAAPRTCTCGAAAEVSGRKGRERTSAYAMSSTRRDPRCGRRRRTLPACGRVRPRRRDEGCSPRRRDEEGRQRRRGPARTPGVSPPRVGPAALHGVAFC